MIQTNRPYVTSARRNPRYVKPVIENPHCIVCGVDTSGKQGTYTWCCKECLEQGKLPFNINDEVYTILNESTWGKEPEIKKCKVVRVTGTLNTYQLSYIDGRCLFYKTADKIYKTEQECLDKIAQNKAENKYMGKMQEIYRLMKELTPEEVEKCDIQTLLRLLINTSINMQENP